MQIANRDSITDEQVAQMISDNEELGLYLHMQPIDASAIKKGQKLEGTTYANIFDNGVAVLDLIGPIFPRANMMTKYSGAISISQFTNDFIRTYNNDDVKAIVLNIDSPGGDVRGIGDAADIMFKLAQKGKKPVKTFAFGYMASAAYYIGAIANDITGSKHSVVGSIGVVMEMQKSGKDTVEITSSQSPYKRIDPSTDEGANRIRQRLDDIAEIFINDIAKYRGVNSETILSNYGQGDVFVGPRAKKQGLLDKIGTLSSVVDEAAREAGNKVTSRRRVKAVDESRPSILNFTEEETMKFADLMNKFKASTETTLNDDQTQDAANLAEESEEPAVASQGQEEEVVPQLSREELEERFSDSAELFAVTLTTESKIYPAQQAHAASDLMNAKIDDVVHGGTVKFVDENGILAEGTREAAVRARYNAMPKHTMTQEAVKGIKDGSTEAKVLKESEPDKEKSDGPMSAERRAELLATTELGRRVLAAQKK